MIKLFYILINTVIFYNGFSPLFISKKKFHNKKFIIKNEKNIISKKKIVNISSYINGKKPSKFSLKLSNIQKKKIKKNALRIIKRSSIYLSSIILLKFVDKNFLNYYITIQWNIFFNGISKKIYTKNHDVYTSYNEKSIIDDYDRQYLSMNKLDVFKDDNTLEEKDMSLINDFEKTLNDKKSDEYILSIKEFFQGNGKELRFQNPSYIKLFINTLLQKMIKDDNKPKKSLKCKECLNIMDIFYDNINIYWSHILTNDEMIILLNNFYPTIIKILKLYDCKINLDKIELINQYINVCNSVIKYLERIEKNFIYHSISEKTISDLCSFIIFHYNYYCLSIQDNIDNYQSNTINNLLDKFNYILITNYGKYNLRNIIKELSKKKIFIHGFNTEESGNIMFLQQKWRIQLLNDQSTTKPMNHIVEELMGTDKIKSLTTTWFSYRNAQENLTKKTPIPMGKNLAIHQNKSKLPKPQHSSNSRT